MADEFVFATPSDAVCPSCGVVLTEENVFRRLDGSAPALAETDVPGVVEEVDVPVYVLQCVTCAVENR